MVVTNVPSGLKNSTAIVQPLQSQTTSSSLTTEYTPQKRRPSNVSPSDTVNPQPAPQSEKASIQQTTPSAPTPFTQSKVDTSTLPPVTAPSTHPSIDPTIPGVHEGRPIFEHDMDALADKPWRKPGSNISDWFNYGFDEISWEAYCYRRRQLGDDATVLRANVIVS
jgi:pre-mRNA 3'-end-processing factor FIP1